MGGVKRHAIYIYGFFLCSLLLVYCFFVPPFRKFDEHAHFQRVMALTSGQFFCRWDTSTDQPYFVTSESIKKIINTVGASILEKFPISFYKQSYPYVRDTKNVKIYDMCYFPVYGYIPPTIGAIVSIPFDNLLVTFFSARFFTLLFFVLCLLVSYRVAPIRYRLLILLYASLPIVLHQVTSVSYDATIISLSIVLFSLFTAFLDAKRITFIRFIVFSVLLLYFLAAKEGYYLFIFLPLWLLTRCTFKRHKNIFIGILVLLFLFFLYLFIQTRISWLSDDMLFRYELSISDPSSFFKLLNYTFWNKQDIYLQGILTTLGWFEYNIPLSVFWLYSVLFGVIFYRIVQNEKKTLSLISSIMLFVLILCSAILLFYLFYLYLTPVGQSFIEGTQGRYFVPLMLFMTYAVSQIIVNIDKKAKIILGIVITGLFLLFITVKTVYIRYFDYSQLVRGGEIVQKKEKLEKSTGLQNHLVVDKPMRFVLPVEKGSKIGGFEFVPVNPDHTPIGSIYSYAIKDPECNAVYRQGYLDEVRVQYDGVYTGYVQILDYSDDQLCFEIAPIKMKSEKTYMKILTDENNIPVITFLYQLK